MPRRGGGDAVLTIGGGQRPRRVRAAMLACLVLPLAAQASRPAPLPEPEDLIAFMRGGHLFVVRPDGTCERRLGTTDLEYDRPLGWDADGRRVFVWLDPGGWRVGAIDVATGSCTDLTPGRADCRMARASPDGRHIAFQQGGVGVCVMRADGSDVRVLSPLGHRDAPPAWSPDGARIAFADLRPVGERAVELDVHVVAAAGGEARRVIAAADEPAWGADGSALFAVARRGGRRDVVAVALADGSERRVTDDAAAESDLVPSPDGRRLAFVASRGEQQALVVIDADGRHRRELAAVRGRPQPPTWSPDGRRLAFVSLAAGAGGAAADEALVLSSVDVATGSVARITVAAAWPAWRPRRH
jgi:Tol biopolymer transport system component